MSDRRNPAADDFEFIRARIEQIKKEREEADKASNAPVMQPIFENDYCVGMASIEECNLASYNEAVGIPQDAINAVGTETAPRDWQASSGYPLYDFLELDENDEVVGFQKAVKAEQQKATLRVLELIREHAILPLKRF